MNPAITDKKREQYEACLDGWQIGEKIGQGSIGRVFELHKGEDRAALKVICLPDGEDDIRRAVSAGVRAEDLPQYYDNVLRLFVSEYECLELLKDNEHIVRYDGHWIIPHEDGIGGDILIRMELLTPLVDYSLDHDITEEDVIQIGEDISDALAACEREGLLHRDVKPDNIFVSPDRIFKLGDFGIARVIEETEMNLSQKGTLTYMAPEVYRGEPYGHKADIYSLGLVLYKYLNQGRLPFMPSYPEKIGYTDGENALGMRVRKEPVQPPADGSPALKQVVLTACDPDPDNRFQSAAELNKALKSVRGGSYSGKNGSYSGRTGSYSGAAVNTSNTITSANTRIRHRVSMALVIIALLLAAAAFGIYSKGVTDIEGLAPKEELLIGETLTPELTVQPKWFSSEPVSLTVSDQGIITSDESSKIKAVSVGEAEVTLSVRNYSETVRITVLPKVRKIGGLKDKYDLTEGDTMQLSPELTPDKFKSEPVTYESSDEKVALISGDGLIAALAAGDAEITVSAGGCTREVRVKVNKSSNRPGTQNYSKTSQKSGTNSSEKKDSSQSKKQQKTTNTSKTTEKKESANSGKNEASEGVIDDFDDEYFD